MLAVRGRTEIVCLVAVVAFLLPAARPTEAQQIVEALVPFASVELARSNFANRPPPAKLTVAGRKLFRARFGLRATFTLGAESDGIDLANDEIRVTFGSFSTTVPADRTSYLSSDGTILRYRTRVLNDVRRLIIKPRNEQWFLRVRATRINIPEPALFTIQIGDDIGQVDLSTGLTPADILATVQGVVSARLPRAGVARARVRVPCPEGSCEILTDPRGAVSTTASFGDQNVVFDGTSADDRPLPVVGERLRIRAGTNEFGLRVLPLLEPATRKPVQAGVQGPTSAFTYPAGATDPEVTISIPPSATIEFPDGTTGSVELILSRLSMDRLPKPLPGGIGAAAIYAAAPFGTRISPCADLTIRNPLGGLADGDPVPLTVFDYVSGAWRLLSNAEVTDGGRLLVAPNALCEFSIFFIPCTPLITTVEASTRYKGTKVARVPVYIAGHSTLSDATDGDEPNVRVENIAVGCLETPQEIRAWAALPLPEGYGYLSGASDLLMPAHNDVTDLVEITLYMCGDGIREGFEECDGADFGDTTCADFGHEGGALRCRATCIIDTHECRTCGNGVVEPGEECEASDDSLCPGLCRSDCSCPPVCGDGRRNQADEQCDGADDVLCPGQCGTDCLCPPPPTTTTTLPPSECPIAFELTPHARAVSRSGATALEIGFTGLGHDRDIAGGRPLVFSAQCQNPTFPCGTCTLTGLETIEGRCANDPAIVCDTINAADEDDCGGARCDVFFLPPLHNLWGGGPGCFVERLETEPTGAIDNETGDTALRVELAADMYFGVAATQPCPICIGDDAANDGLRNGTCKGGQRDGEDCDAHGFDPTFGSTSLDCLPDPGTLGAALPLQRTVTLSTTTETLPFTSPCDFPLSDLTCACAVCSGDTSTPCAGEQDCIDAGTTGPCDRRGDGTLRAPNTCDGYQCADTGDGIHGRCLTGPDDRFCDGMLFAHGTPYLPCLTNADCDAASDSCAGDCGQCTIVERRRCFLDPIVTETFASRQRIVASDVQCLAPGVSAGLDQVAGLAGPERMTIEFDVRRRFAPP